MSQFGNFHVSSPLFMPRNGFWFWITTRKTPTIPKRISGADWTFNRTSVAIRHCQYATYVPTPLSSFCRIPNGVQSIASLTLYLAFHRSHTTDLWTTGLPQWKCSFTKLGCVYTRASGMVHGINQDLGMRSLTWYPITGSILLCAIAILVSAGLIWMSERKKAAVGRRLAYPQNMRSTIWGEIGPSFLTIIFEW